MSGKLAWTLGILMAVVGLALFAVGFLSRDASKVAEAIDGVPGAIPSRDTNEELAKDRRQAIAELEARQSLVRGSAGIEDGVIIYSKYRMTGGDFAAQVWPQEKLVLNRELEEVTVKPTRWNNRGEVETRNIPSDIDKFAPFDALLSADQAFTAGNHRLGRLAATCIREFIAIAIQEARLVATESGAKPVFEVIRFDFSGDFAKFAETGSPDTYGDADPWIRRNFMVEYIADPRLADRINRSFFSRPAQPPHIRVVRVSMIPNDTPVSIVRPVKVEEVRQFFRNSTSGRLYLTRLAGNQGRESWLDILNRDDAGLAEWLKVTSNMDALRVIMDADPTHFREPIPTRAKLWMQLLENEPPMDSPLALPLTKASEGIPAESIRSGN
jgi:hypothetical protein